MSSGVLTCNCGAINYALDVPLPGSTELCHCNPCRQATGAFFGGWVRLKSGPPSDLLAKCTVYRSSKTHERYFCSTCGTKTLIHAHQSSDGKVKDGWFAFGGAIDLDSMAAEAVNVLNVERHKWLCDTKDGGMAPFMSSLHGSSIPCYDVNQDSKQIDADELTALTQEADALPLPAADEMLKGECRCGGVSLLIQRACPEDASVSQLDRYIPKDSSGNPTGKHMAFCCVCRYCRLHSGVSLTPWMYPPPMQVINPVTNAPFAQHREVDTPAGKEANKGQTIRHFWSSPDSCRSFCYVCGASIFYTVTKRLEILNVAPGLLRAEEGVMARRWLSWQWGRTAWWKEGTTQQDVMEAWQATADASKDQTYV